MFIGKAICQICKNITMNAIPIQKEVSAESKSEVVNPKILCTDRPQPQKMIKRSVQLNGIQSNGSSIDFGSV